MFAPSVLVRTSPVSPSYYWWWGGGSPGTGTSQNQWMCKGPGFLAWEGPSHQPTPGSWAEQRWGSPPSPGPSPAWVLRSEPPAPRCASWPGWPEGLGASQHWPKLFGASWAWSGRLGKKAQVNPGPPRLPSPAGALCRSSTRADLEGPPEG